MKIEIENLKALVYLKDLNNYQLSLAINEFNRLIDYVNELEQLTIPRVSKSVAKQYAEFCVRCDREGLPLLELDDYIKQYCC